MKKNILMFCVGCLLALGIGTKLRASNFELRCGVIAMVPMCCTVDLTTGEAVHCALML